MFNLGFLIACCSIVYRNRPILKAIEEIAKAGYRGVEIWYEHIHDFDEARLCELAEHCTRLNLTIVAIAPYFSFTRGRQAGIDSLLTAEKVLHASRILKVGKIRTFVDCGPDGLPSSRATGSDWKAAEEGLRALCNMDSSVEFVLETHKNTLADTLPSVSRLLKEVSRSNLRLNYQATADFLDRGYFQCIEALFPAISHMHWQQIRTDGSETYIEEPGLIDFRRLIDVLSAKGYAGSASVEYCWLPMEESRVHSSWKFLHELLTTEDDKVGR